MYDECNIIHFCMYDNDEFYMYNGGCDRPTLYWEDCDNS